MPEWTIPSTRPNDQCERTLCSVESASNDRSQRPDRCQITIWQGFWIPTGPRWLFPAHPIASAGCRSTTPNGSNGFRIGR